MNNKLPNALLILCAPSRIGWRLTHRRIAIRGAKLVKTLARLSSLSLGLALFVQSLVFVAPVAAQVSVGGEDDGGTPPPQAGRSYTPMQRKVVAAPPINVAVAAAKEALAPTSIGLGEIRAIHAPSARPNRARGAVALPPELASVPHRGRTPLLPPPSATGVSPTPSKTFKGEFLSGLTIPPDTDGAVGFNHVMNVTNDRIRITTRDGVEQLRMTLDAFWSGVVLEGGAVPATFDPKVLFDRFNNRYIFITSANAFALSSAMLFAVSQTSDPTGMWNRFFVDADPAATAAGGIWIDYPSVGFNKNWIVVNENSFGYGTTGTGYQRADVYVIDKQAAYANTLTSVSAFMGDFPTVCLSSATPELELGCGFTMVPTVVEDNTSNTMFLIEDWDATAAQLRISKLTGTPSAPVLTVATQFPQSLNSWRFNAARIATSGGYMPQRQQAAHLSSGQRIMANDSRVQNAVLRNGSLWTAHHVMVAATPTAAGTQVGTAANPDIRSAAQWWEIDPTIENSMVGTLPIQRARLEDPLADNCHNGAGGNRTVGPCTSTATQVGQFFSFPTIAVNQNDDVLIGFSMMSPLTYANTAYAFRAGTDPINTTRDPVVFRPGQANYNIGAGSGAGRQNRWGDYSATQTDPLNDTDFWTVQEYAGKVRDDFGAGLAGNWETWWAQVKPTGPTPINSTTGLIISEFRLRGTQGARDEFIELYNPSTSPIRVTTTDNSEGWAVASSNGAAITTLAVVPVGTVIPARGHFLIADNPDGVTGPTLVYSLNGYPTVTAPGMPPGFVRGADSDTGFSLDISDISGIALFNTATVANFSALTVLDAAGPTTLPGGSIFREGAGFAPLPTTNLQYSMHRSQVGGTPADTGNNAADFILNDVAATAGQRLGAPGPENLDGPNLNTNVFVDRFDTSVGTNTAPNRFRDLTPVTNGALGTLSFRRRVQNLTGQPVTRLRFRIKQISTLNAPVAFGTADLRALTSGMIIVNGQPVEGTLVEEPATQALGGGWNTSWSLALPAPLAPSATINVQYVVGVQTGGSFSIFINVEALP